HGCTRCHSHRGRLQSWRGNTDASVFCHRRDQAGAPVTSRPPTGSEVRDQKYGVIAGYHLSEIFCDPLAFGCTPSAVSAPSFALNPVHWSTTTMGDVAVLLPVAQAGIMSLNAVTRAPQSGHAQVVQVAVLIGFMGMSLATRMTTRGLAARRASTTVEYA